MDTKETPTKIPRISSRSSTINAQGVTGTGSMKSSTSVASNRRSSIIISASLGGKGNSFDPSPSPHAGSMVSDFGTLEPTETPTTHFATMTERGVRGSPQSSHHRVPKPTPLAGLVSSKPPPTKESLLNLRKSSAPTISNTHASSSTISASGGAQSNDSHHSISSKLAGLTPSKSFKLLTPKVSLPVTRTSPAISNIVPPSTPGSTRQSLSTPSPVSSSADDDEVLADEEMLAYIRRAQARKIAAGAKKEELDDLLRFPEPIPPTPASTPACT